MDGDVGGFVLQSWWLVWYVVGVFGEDYQGVVGVYRGYVVIDQVCFVVVGDVVGCLYWFVYEWVVGYGLFYYVVGVGQQ